MDSVLTRLLLGSVAMLVALTTLVLVRKGRRDTLEWRYSQRRARMRASLLRGDPEDLRACFASIRRDGDGQVDLIVAIDLAEAALTGWHRCRVQAAMTASGLAGSLERLLGSRNAAARGRAALLLSKAAVPGASAKIAALLRDRDPDARLAAVSSLAAIADRTGTEALIEALANEALPAERIVERLGVVSAVDAILLTFEREAVAPRYAHGRSLRAHLATALALAGDARAGDAMVQLLKSSDPEERVAAARALATVRARDAVEALCDALSDQAWQVRAQAARSLGRLGAGQAIGKLERCLGDIAWWVRSNSADALRAMGEPGASALRRALSNGDRYARDRAREALDVMAVSA